MSRRHRGNVEQARLTGVDHLFGRDMRRDGWFIDEELVAQERRRTAIRDAERPSEIGPDPAVIWALRNRRRG